MAPEGASLGLAHLGLAENLPAFAHATETQAVGQTETPTMAGIVKVLRLMTDYHCHPLWSSDGNNIDPADLPLSDSLRSDLFDWAAAYDSTLCLDNPAASAFATVEDEQRFDSTGTALWERVRAELGPEYRVTYFLNGTVIEPQE